MISEFQPRACDPVIKIADIAYLRFGRRDVALACRYFKDFGLIESARDNGRIYFRGILPQHHCVIIEPARHDSFLAMGLRAKSHDDLAHLAHAMQATIQQSPEPGGGRRVELVDPSGLRVEVVHGLQDLPTLPHREARLANGPLARPRINRPQPILAAPADVFRLGHLVLQRQEFARNANWYINTFGLIASDVEVLPVSGEAVLTFLRCDRGADLSDHHTIVIAAGPQDTYDHAAFEALDLDSVALGCEWLQHQGWVKSWGVGRHVLGSQLFSYHYDPSGFAVEHYTDGDLFDADYPTRYHPTCKSGLYAWGPDLPAHFIDMRPSLTLITAIIRGLRTRTEFSLKRLAAMKRAFDVPARPWVGRRFQRPKAL